MTDNTQVETTGAESPASQPAPTSNTVPATSSAPSGGVDLNDPTVQAAIAREAQRQKDKELAKVHKQYQEQIRSVRGAAKTRLSQLGDQHADDWDQYLEVQQKAMQYDAVQAEAQQWAQWSGYVESVASAYGLKGSDPRLTSAQTAEQVVELAKAAMAEDARAERERIKREAEQAERQRVDSKVASGALDTLGAGVPVAPNSEAALRREYEAKLKPLQGNVDAIYKLQREYRTKGLQL